MYEKLKEKIPAQWRVQSFSKNKPQAQLIAYIDARDVMDMLDKVIGAGNWQSDFKTIGDKVYGGIGIFDEKTGWVWKWDCGTESQTEGEKGQASDAFKRAGVKWGIGRFLYDMGVQYLPANEIKKDNNYPYVVDNQGKRVWDITKHINNLK